MKFKNKSMVLSAGTTISQKFVKMTNTEGNREVPAICSLGLLENTELFLWAHMCE